MIKIRTLFCLSLITALSVCAGEPVPGNAGSEPAPDSELLAKIEAMPDNTWLKLPPLKTVGDMGVLNKDPDYRRIGPRVRDYCNRMVWAPDRKRALYCGGGHNIHPWNDVWEYDLASNTWICLYGADPAPPRFPADKEAEAVAWYKEHVVIRDGAVRTPRGGPLRPCHTWWAFCYDSDQKRMLFLESHKGLFTVNKAALATAHGLDPKDPMLQTFGSQQGDAWLFYFDPQKREWTEVLTKVPKAYESAMLEHLPDQKTLWWASGKTYLLDSAQKEWKPMTKDRFASGGESAYDPESKKIVAVLGFQTWVYDCSANTWTLALEKSPDFGVVPSSTFCYDSVAKKFVLYTYAPIKDKPDAGVRLWLYDLRENKWTDPAPQGETPKVGNVAGYYDVARNVTVIYSNSQMWVYRAKRAGK